MKGTRDSNIDFFVYLVIIAPLSAPEAKKGHLIKCPPVQVLDQKETYKPPSLILGQTKAV
jgi:hypothetical protein